MPRESLLFEQKVRRPEKIDSQGLKMRTEICVFERLNLQNAVLFVLPAASNANRGVEALQNSAVKIKIVAAKIEIIAARKIFVSKENQKMSARRAPPARRIFFFDCELSLFP